MRLSPITLFTSLLATTVFAQGTETESEAAPAAADNAVEEVADLSTTFNGVKVPAIPDIDGEQFNTTVKDGYWFVKHHSPYCPHCISIAPTWQTLHEFYYTSKPVPGSADDASTSMNTFQAYYNFRFGSLDCIAFGSACEAHDVHAWPTFILYKDGEPQKRFEGSKDIAGLSAYIEGVLETIKPGSRPVGGPKLPKVGDTSIEQPAQAAAAPAAPVVPVAPVSAVATPTPAPVVAAPVVADQQKDKPVGEAAKESKVESTVVDHVLTATPISNKPTKPTLTPNPLGTSVSLTAETFQNRVTMSQEPWFIKFYAPWCHHCQAMAPNWVQLGKEMKGNLNIGEVNCDVESRLCKDVRLRGFPTILFFVGGERVEYDGLRGLGDFVSYANKAIDIGGGVKDIDAAGFKELEEKEEVIFVYFYDHATTTEDFAALERLTLSLIGHAKLVKTSSSLLAERFKITTWPRLLVSRDGRPTYYTALAPQDMRDFRKVLHWMQSVWLPIVPELTASNSREIMDGKLVVLGILTREHADEFLIAKKEIKSAALEWMDKQTQRFQLERQELRDAKQLRLEEAEDRNDQRALRAAKSIRINMDRTDRKEVGFAWVDGVFWERWIRTTYGIEAKEGEKVIINDEDNRRYWDTTITGNYIIPSRTSILETLPKVVDSPPRISPKSTISSFEKFFFRIRRAISGHIYLSTVAILGLLAAGAYWGRGRVRRSKGGFFRLDDEKGGLLGGNSNGKVD
ncbi:thioredoxin [Phlyctema vagabunda]|uniref:Thioredoxin n=1 Tax=Phlyctema vagabunda TaxID=108571 RepID=A0ABR4P5R1_9HELO